jgi:hypothetical protein
MAIPDNPHVAELRVALKLAALSYVESGKRSEPCEALALSATVDLCGAAVYYFNGLARLTGEASYIEDRTIVMGDVPSAGASAEEVQIVRARVGLKLAAIRYAAARQGDDACAEFTRAAIHDLCTAAVGYREALGGAPIPTDVAYKSARLDDGT